jgi:outer membrane protein OmpA-like peptidoglycan-associated protein
MSGAVAMARLGAGMVAVALGLAGWPAAAEPATQPGLDPLPSVKPERSAEAPGPGLLARIDFAPEEMTLTPLEQDRLARVVSRLKGEPAAPVVIVAFAGADGSAMSARRISLGRALAVRSFLMERGIQSGRLTVQAHEASAGSGPAERVDILWPPR